MNLNYSLEDINLASQFIISNSKTNRFLFFGPIGIGKTTLIKQLCSDLGVIDLVSSPTFSIVNQYKTNNGPMQIVVDLLEIAANCVRMHGKGRQIIARAKAFISYSSNNDCTHTLIITKFKTNLIK